jgi:intein/homing endonuclease
MSLQRETISTTEEKRIVLGLIVSTEFIQEIEPIFRLDYFKNSYLRTVAEWSHSFYEEYKKAPFIHIKDIFNSEKHQLPETDADLIEILLTDLDSKYSEGEINLKYWVEECTDYFRKRELEIVVNNISVLSSKGDLVSAENEIARFKKVSLDIGYKSIIKISDLNTQEELYRKRDQEEANFFNLPGDLGKYLGNQKRGDVVGYFGPAKRGKCLPGDNLIYLSDGTIKTLKEVIEQKIEGVLSKDANNHFVSDTVTNWIDCGIKQEFTVTTKSRRKIKTSKEHHFFTPYGWKPLHELKVGDNVALAKKIAPECTSSVPEKELKMLAYLIADGHLGTSISFTKKDTVIMDDFLDCLSYFGNTYRIEKNLIQVELHVGKVRDLVRDVGLFDTRSGNKFIPDYIMQSNDTSLRIFLKTLFTCDGSIWVDRGIVLVDYSTKSSLLAEQVLYCLSRFGVFGKLFTAKINGQTYYEIAISSNSGVKQFMDEIGFTFSKQEKALSLCEDLICKRDYIDVIPHKFVKELGDCLTNDPNSSIHPSDNETFREAYKKGKHVSRYTFGLIAPKNHPVLNNDLIWDTITSIKAGKLVPMYDLTVKNNHNFIANSFVVHNSWTLLNNFKYGILSKKKTLFFSIEMTDTEVLPRVNQSFFPMIDKDDGEQYFPAFDCVHNQNGSCADRMSPTVVLEGGEAVPDPSHIPCTKCKGDGSFRYKVAVYQDKMFRYKNDIFEVRKNHKKYKGMWEKYARISCHPKYSLTYDLMLSDIDALWKKEMWFPDILVIDYIDILQIPSKFDDYRLEDEKWKLLAKIAGQTNTLVITATQANKAGHVAGTLDSTHQGGFYGKNRHVNLMVGLNQTPQNKKDGIMEFGITEARSVDYIPGRLCTVLQDYKTGQAYLDSYYDVNQVLKIGG